MMDWQVWTYLALSFLLPFLGIVCGVHYERWQRGSQKQTRPSWSSYRDWRGE